MQINKWIKEKSKIHTISELYKMYDECISKTGSMMSEKTYVRLARKIFNELNGTPKPKETVPQLKREFTPGNQYLELKSHEIRTEEELLVYSKTDLSKWKVKRCTINTWGKEGNSNYQIKCWLEEKVFNFDEYKKDTLKELKNCSPISFPAIKRKKEKDGCLLKVDIPDFHFGLLGWEKETGDADFDIKMAPLLYGDCINNFIEITKSFNISKILFPIGSDYFNVNNAVSTTAKGTFQDEDCRWQKTYIEGLRVLRLAINTLRKTADVDVVVIPGNHDENLIFYAGAAIEAWYEKDKHVNINNSPKSIKTYEWQKNLIGMAHGSGLKLKDLPLLLATIAPEAWGRTLHREFHTAHLHHEIVKEIQKVKVRCVPALSPLSAYSAKKGYNSTRESLAHIFHPTKGNIAQFNYRV